MGKGFRVVVSLTRFGNSRKSRGFVGERMRVDWVVGLDFVGFDRLL